MKIRLVKIAGIAAAGLLITTVPLDAAERARSVPLRVTWVRPDLVPAGVRPSRARLERRVPALAVPGHKLIDPAAGDVMTPRELARAASLEHDRIHHVPSQTHRVRSVDFAASTSLNSAAGHATPPAARQFQKSSKRKYAQV